MTPGLSDSSPLVAQFGRYRFEFASRRLSRAGHELPIQEQQARLLAILLQRNGEVVTREELQTILWPDKHYLEFDAGLNTAVKKLRQVLKDDAAEPRFIQTVPKKGYRFIGDLAWEPTGAIPQNEAVAAEIPSVSQPPEMENPAPLPRHHDTRQWLLVGLAVIGVVLLSLSLLALFRTHQPAEPVERQLTSNSAEDAVVDSSISPDGRYLAYTNLRHVMIQDLREHNTYTLPNLDRLRVFRVSWTYQSDRLLVTGYETPEAISSLWQVSILGNEEPRKFAENVYEARQSPDGKQMALVSADRGNISLLSYETREVRRRLPGHRIHSTCWAPDSRSVWFAESPEYESWIPIRALPVDATKPPGQPSKFYRLRSLWLLPDSRIALLLGEGIYSAHVDLQTGRVTDRPVLRIAVGDGLALTGTMDGKIAYQKVESGSDVFIGDLSNGNMRLTNTHRLTRDDAQDFAHSWTHDSRSVLFESDRTGSYAIYSQPWDAADPQILVSGNGNAVKPVVTPDGNSVLYVWAARGGGYSTGKIMRIPLAGGSPVEIYSFTHPVAFHCPTQRGPLCVLDERVGDTEQFSYLDPVRGKLGPVRPPEPMPVELDWDLSPDGSTIAVLPRSGNDDRIWLFQGSLPRRELRIANAKQLRSVNWWADGKGFFLPGFGDGLRVLLSAPLAGQAVNISQEISGFPSWGVPSPDGKRLAYIAFLTSQKVWLVEHF